MGRPDDNCLRERGSRHSAIGPVGDNTKSLRGFEILGERQRIIVDNPHFAQHFTRLLLNAGENYARTLSMAAFKKLL